jgi:hypothetical protein
MPKTANKTATITKAFGEDLRTPLDFSYSYEELETGDEIPAKEVPDADDLLTFVNQRRNASARAAEQNKALKAAGYEPKPLEENQAAQIRMMVKALMAADKNRTEADATQVAKTALGIA